MVNSAVKNYEFNAEVGKVLNLMINSIYTKKEIAIRELISNASDACDKIRYQSLQNSELMEADTELKISITIDKDKKQLIIADNGIGMNEEDLIQHLGCIANSGTQKFLEQLNKNDNSNVDLIGQFGVGFYAAFMIAENVTVITKKAGESNAYMWQSKGDGTYSIGAVEGEKTHGTEIILQLKTDEFLNKHRIQNIINTYSDHIAFPIELTDEENKTEVINKASAIWARSKSEITEEQYNEFYNYVSHLPGNPWLTMHNNVEGALSYINLLFIPSQRPFNLFNPERKSSVRLYIKKVFISDDVSNLIPSYLRFVQGVVDSEDLPLNISRETLQDNINITKISSSIVKKILSTLKTKSEKDVEGYAAFWQNFGEVLKEGLCEPMLQEKEKLFEVCRFYSLNNPNELISLDDYIANMKENQKEIFYITGTDRHVLEGHPQLEGFKKRGIDVLLLTDHVDEFWITVTHEYKQKQISSVLQSETNLNDIEKIEEEVSKGEDEEKESEGANEKLINFFKETLGEAVKEVRVSKKLVESPACLAVAQGGMNIRMERFLVEQKQMQKQSAKILEINPKHQILKGMLAKLEKGKVGEEEQDIAKVVFDLACLNEGDVIADVHAFAKRVNKFLK